ncbi:mannosyltransferase [Sporothrix eucalyptigena]|uniref:Mannosyltransferase n=1 Tax=Sporothrix eucalyptigena TaxID=1812306 RepID=A0ABP0BDE7_9PEZI
MLLYIRRQRPRALFTIVLVTIIGLVLYGHMNAGGLFEVMAGSSSSRKIHLRTASHQPGTSKWAPFLYSLPRPPPRGGVPPSKEMLRYWKLLLKAMIDARPPPDQVVIVPESVTDDDIQPDPDRDQNRLRIDKTHLPSSLRDSLKGAHADFVRVAKSLGLQLPYSGKTFGRRTGAAEIEAQAEAAAAAEAATHPQNRKLNGFVTVTRPAKTEPTADAHGHGAPAYPGPRRGIVMTAGGSYVGIAVTSILMLRRNGSLLPVQLFLDSDSDYDPHLCEKVLPALGTECHIMQRFWETTPAMPPLEKFQFKVFSILLSSFQEVLFFDADCWPIHNPDYLFETAPFTTHGLVTWPDFWLSTTAPVLYDILDITPPRLSERRSSESGVLLYDKARHGTSLIMAAYYNFYGPSYYYPLLSQGAIGQGDKETFLHGAMVMGNPFYAVHTRIGILGRWINGTYIGAAMRQADPVEDYRLVTEDERGGSPPTLGRRQHIQELEERGEGTHARWLFVHHNLFKIDLRHLAQSMRGVYAKNELGRLGRLWDVDADFNRDAGYDVERAMWDEVRAAVCGHQHGFFMTSRECADLETYYRAVFAQ